MAANALRFLCDGAPVSTNQGYQPARWGKRHGFVLTPEGEGYKQRLHLAAVMAWQRAGRPEPLTRAVVGVRFRFRTNGSDIDGPLKFALDSVQKARLVVNDNRVVRLVVEKASDGPPRTEVGISSVDACCPRCGCSCGAVLAPEHTDWTEAVEAADEAEQERLRVPKDLDAGPA